jgi:tetratricopeptide (TPR) repeat protein
MFMNRIFLFLCSAYLATTVVQSFSSSCELQKNEISKTGKGKVEEKADENNEAEAISALKDVTLGYEKVLASSYGKTLIEGSAAALNQIATAFYTLGEKTEKIGNKVESQGWYGKSAEFFSKAAKSGSKEALYNAGLAFSKIGDYKKAEENYKLCIKTVDEKMDFAINTGGERETADDEKNSGLVLKSAINLVILMLDKKINLKIEEISGFVKLSEKYLNDKKSPELLQTCMILLTDLNTTEGKSEEDSKDMSVPKVGQEAVILKASNVVAH